jgi:sulfate transport system substrate-binding protein
VAVVDKNVDKKGTRKVAEAYLSTCTRRRPDIAGRNFYRPTDAKAKAKYAAQFPPLKLFTIDEAFGGWSAADKAHFADGGSFDQIYAPR